MDANGILNVSAKDKGTGKEQKITIQASGGLTEADIEKMIKDAEMNAAEDHKRREIIDARNQADGTIASIRKELEEHGSKISADDKQKLEDVLKDAEEIIKGEDKEAITGVTQKIFEAAAPLYAAMQSEQQTEQAEPNVNPDIVDAEFTEVKE